MATDSSSTDTRATEETTTSDDAGDTEQRSVAAEAGAEREIGRDAAEGDPDRGAETNIARRSGARAVSEPATPEMRGVEPMEIVEVRRAPRCFTLLEFIKREFYAINCIVAFVVLLVILMVYLFVGF